MIKKNSLYEVFQGKGNLDPRNGKRQSSQLNTYQSNTKPTKNSNSISQTTKRRYNSNIPINLTTQSTSDNFYEVTAGTFDSATQGTLKTQLSRNVTKASERSNSTHKALNTSYKNMYERQKEWADSIK